MRHLCLFTIGELYYHRIFKVLNKVCSNQLTGFCRTQLLTERYFQTDHNIIYTKKYERRGGSPAAKTLQTNPQIQKATSRIR